MGRSRVRVPHATLAVVDEARACTRCADALPHEPRPVLRVGPRARVVVVGQAPGARVHESGVPWQDDSGDHLLEWLQIDRATFEDTSLFAVLPMGFCFPGRKAGGDLPPRPECAPLWHGPIFAELDDVELVLLVGQYAHAGYLGGRQRSSLTETVRAFETYLPDLFPLPHPSWRSKLWMAKNPWFASDVLPALRARVHDVIGV